MREISGEVRKDIVHGLWSFAPWRPEVYTNRCATRHHSIKLRLGLHVLHWPTHFVPKNTERERAPNPRRRFYFFFLEKQKILLLAEKIILLLINDRLLFQILLIRILQVVAGCGIFNGPDSSGPKRRHKPQGPKRQAIF